MRRISELGGNRPLAILGGRTLKENHEWWLDRERRGANSGGPNWVPPPPRADEPPPETDNEAEALKWHLERCGVPDRIAAVLQAGPSETHAVQAVRQWWGLGRGFMLLHGDTGGGKTVAACSAFLRMRRTVRWRGGEYADWDSADCAFITAGELSRLGYFSDDAKALLEHVGKVTCLVLDDLGAELASESWQATLLDIVAERHGRTRCRTLLTSNVSARRPEAGKPSPFEARYGARIARRIRDSGSVVAVEADRSDEPRGGASGAVQSSAEHGGHVPARRIVPTQEGRAP